MLFCYACVDSFGQLLTYLTLDTCSTSLLTTVSDHTNIFMLLRGFVLFSLSNQRQYLASLCPFIFVSSSLRSTRWAPVTVWFDHNLNSWLSNFLSLHSYYWCLILVRISRWRLRPSPNLLILLLHELLQAVSALGQSSYHPCVTPPARTRLSVPWSDSALYQYTSFIAFPCSLR
jgi:hypothetical protein